MTKKPAKRKIGRPRLPPGEKRPAPIGFRPTPDLLKKLKAAAKDKGRSMAQEMVSRLEKTFAMWKLQGRGPPAHSFLGGGRHHATASSPKKASNSFFR